MEPPASTTIAEEALCSLENFKRICRVLESEDRSLPSTQPHRGFTSESFKDAFGRFNVWIGNIGALSRDRSSLDRRLAHTDVKLEVLRLIRQLRSCLSELWEILSNQREELTWYATDAVEAFESLSDDDFSEFEEITNACTPEEDDAVERDQPDPNLERQTESHQLYLVVNETITSLFKLSIFIRTSTKREKFAKSSAEKSYETQPDILHVRDRFPFASPNTKLVERLGKANAQRRQWLSYKKRHREKLGTSSFPEEATDVQIFRSTAESTTQSKNKHEYHGGTSTISAGIRSAISALSSTDASTFYERSGEGQGNEDDSEAGFSETTYNESQRSDSENATYIPQPPRDSEGQNPFECPYCFTILTISSRTDWARHVHSDLASYVCTQDNCSHPLFESRHQWFNHELELHRLEWMCSHCPNTFSAAEDLKGHLKQQHAKYFNNNQLDSLVAQAGKSLKRIPASACPLCDYDALLRRRMNIGQATLADREPIQVRPKAFAAHLGRHLEQLALFVLPKSELMELTEPPVHSIAAQDGDLPGKSVSTDDSGEEDVYRSNRSLTPDSDDIGLPVETHASDSTRVEAKVLAPEHDEIHEEVTEAPELAMGWLPPMNFTPPIPDFDVEDSDWAPRREDSMFGGDLFTPGWVRGFGKDKEGFCGRCEPGVWHKMEDQSYENDLTYRHGIDSSGIPLARPLAIRPVEGKEKQWEGYCEDCQGWRTLRTTKRGWNWFRHCIKEHKHTKGEEATGPPGAIGQIDNLIGHIKMGDLLSITSLIENQPLLLDDRDIGSRTPLHYAAEVGFLEALEYIINKYSERTTKEELERYLNSTSSKGETALMLAASQGHHEAVGLLVKKGVNVDLISDDGQTALDHAAEGGYQWIAESLIRNHADTEISKVYCQIRARNKRNLQQETVQKSQRQEPGNEDQPEDEQTLTPLMIAAINGETETIKALLSTGIDVERSTKEGKTALMLAASKGKAEVIKILLSAGANIDATNSKGWTTLMLAVREKDEKTVELLLSNGADVNHLSPDRWTALAEATFQSQTSMISLLLRCGADTESKSSHDWTPLMHAAYKGDEEAVTLLLDAGAEMDVSSLHDETAILLAAAGCRTKIAQMLLDAGCAPEPAWAVAKPAGMDKNIDETERKAHDNATLGWTPLMLACQNGLDEVVRMLLERNVNLEPQSPYRKRALVIARENGKLEIAKLLEDHAAGRGSKENPQ